MTHKLGLHWLRYHPDKFDMGHVERMQYRSVKPFEWMWSDRDFCRNLLSALPGDSYILARDHPLSEQKDDMWRDPVGTGVRHANEWAEKVRNGQYHLPTDRTFFLGVNEPDATNGDRSAIDRYTVAFLDRLAFFGLRGGAFNFSTGHPRTVDGTVNTLADYTVFEGSHQAVVRGNHIAIAHIYGTAAVPLAKGHYDRLTACKWDDVEWVIGEFGIDEHVIGGGPHVGFHGGFEGRLHEYCGWIDRAIMGVEDIFPYIHDYELYSYDFSHPWGSFNTQVIREFLESYDWQHGKRGKGGSVTKPNDKPINVHLPDIKNDGKPIAIVNVPDGANIRVGPGLNHRVRGAEPFGTVMQVRGRDATGQWWYIDLPHTEGWVSATVVEVRNANNVPVKDDVLPSPPTQQPQDNWQRARAFVKRWEGGFQDYDWDIGNWTGCQVGQGQKKGTKYGISACSYPSLDIRNLTIEQADEIYFRDYWQRSGADTLPWPYCLVVFDTAVNFGAGVAKSWLEQSGDNMLMFIGLRLRGYRKSQAWPQAGNAWVDRVIELAMEASK